MTWVSDWADLGIMPLQDHGIDHPELDLRNMLVGGRIERIVDGRPKLAAGTAGDIHPWLFWRPGLRYMGSWQSMFAALAQPPKDDDEGDSREAERAEAGYLGIGSERNLAPWGDVSRAVLGQGRGGRSSDKGQGGDDEVSALPVQLSDYTVDSSYEQLRVDQPSYLPLYPGGYRLIACAGTEARAQHPLLLPVDSRIVVPHRYGPDRVGTTYSDLVREGELGGSGEYGTSLIDAPGQTLHYVVRFKEMGELENAEGNALAILATASQQGDMAGYIPFIGKPLAEKTDDSKDPVITGEKTEIAPGPSGGSNIESAPADGKGGEPEKKKDPLLIGLASHEASGPWVPGVVGDQHAFEPSKDGEVVSSGHLHIDTYFIENREKDGPHEHNKDPYPDPEKTGYPWVVEMLWDPKVTHNWMSKQRIGKWRRVAWVPLIINGPPPGEPPTTPPSDDPPVDEPPVDEPPPGDPGDGPPTTPGTPDIPTVPQPGDVPGGGFPTPGDPGARGPGDVLPGWEPSEKWSVRSQDHGSYRPRASVDAPMQMGMTAQLWRGQGWEEGSPDLRYVTADVEQARYLVRRQPVVMRTEAMAPQEQPGVFKYERDFQSSRNAGGEAADHAGVWSMPPVFAIDDYRDGAPDAQITYAESYRGFAPGVSVAWGYPSDSQGVVDNGVRARYDASASAWKLEVMDSGSWATMMTVGDGQQLSFFGGTATTQQTSPAMTTVPSITGGETVDASVLATHLAAIKSDMESIVAVLDAYSLSA